MIKFLTNNKVLVAALVSALVLVVQQALQNPPVEWKAVGLAALIAVLGVIGNQWKGQGLSITGIIGTLAYAFVTIYQTGHFSWDQFILQAVLAVLTTFAPSVMPERKDS